MKPLCLSKHAKILVFLLIVLTFSSPPPVTAQAQMQQIAIIPFSINAEKDLTYIKEGISQMLSSRLAWKEKVLVIPGKTILDQIKKTPELSDVSPVKSIVQHTDANYVISGSITEFGGTFSLDTAVYTDTSELPIHTFFGQANTTDDIIPEMSIIAAKINQSVLNRTLPSLAGGENQMNKTQEDLTRANPEKLIPQVIKDAPPEQKPFWKFWKKNTPPAYPGEDFSATETAAPQDLELDEDSSGEKTPFWKFWKKKNADDTTDDMDADAMGNVATGGG